jgi:trimethylamine:corrinoid methyltransferase-like protein
MHSQKPQLQPITPAYRLRILSDEQLAQFKAGTLEILQEAGVHDTFEGWEAAGRPTLLGEAREKVAHILATHEPLPLDEDVARELEKIQRRAQKEI